MNCELFFGATARIIASIMVKVNIVYYTKVGSNKIGVVDAG